MYQGSTPSIPITFEGVNLEEARVFLTLYDEKNKELHTFTSPEDFVISNSGQDSTTMLSLTQEMTLGFGIGPVTIQGRWVFPDGVAGTTQKVSIQMQSALLKDVIHYGDE